MSYRVPNKKFWKNKKVLVTGHSGFKGSWIVIWLIKLGANVTGISLKPLATPNLYSLANIKNLCESKFINICNLEKLKKEIQLIKPDVIIHLAAQSLVRKSYGDPIDTFKVNIMGSANLLEAARTCHSVKSVIMITTDKVYKNNEDGRSYSEDDPLGGHDPYSASKAGAEIIIESYKKSFFQEKKVSVSSARAGNVIGGGDWSKDRLIPDFIRSWQTNSTLEIRSPNSIRPWQHVLEPLSGYLFLAEDTFKDLNLSSYYNFGPNKEDIASVKEVIEMAEKTLKMSKINYIDNFIGLHEANLLSLDTNKSKSLLNYNPKWGLKESILRTINWYQSYHNGESALSLCETDIKEYESISHRDN